jgi:Flp pilus assembly protein TadD
MSTAAAQIHPMSPKRRARLARTLFVLSALAIFIAGLIFTQSAVAVDQGSTAETAFNYVSVMPGESLWQLAETYANGKSQQDWVAEVILLNNLQSADLVAGDKLALP